MSAPIEGQAASPDAKPEPTIFVRSEAWRAAYESWRDYLTHPSLGAEQGRLGLKMVERGAAGRAALRIFWMDPPQDEQLADLLKHPGYLAFAAAARLLADATGDVLSVLHRFDSPKEHAVALQRALLEPPHLPTVPALDDANRLKSQLVAVSDLISNGKLSGDEDQRERRAYWDHELENLEPTTNRAEVARAIENLLRSPRDSDRELRFLNDLRERERNDALAAQLDALIGMEQSSLRGRCERWRALKEWGLRTYRENSGGNSLLKLPVSEGVHRAYADADEPLPHCLRWAYEMQSSTDALHEPAKTAGFDVMGRQPVHILVRAVRDALRGEAVDLQRTTWPIDLIVDELIRSEAGGGVPGDKVPRDKPLRLFFPREKDCRHRCLEVLAMAPSGIPTYQQIADVIEMDHGTVKEAMPRLKAAGHVEQRDEPLRGWYITDPGRQQLRLMNGEA